MGSNALLSVFTELLHKEDYMSKKTKVSCVRVCVCAQRWVISAVFPPGLRKND